MELRQVRYFLALSETRNFTRAAELCNVRQPTLTLAVKRLEEELGGPLIHRERGNTHLTQLGEEVLPFLQQVYDSSAAAFRLAREITDGTRVPLNFGVSDIIRRSALLAPLRETVTGEEGLELRIEGGLDTDLARLLEEGVLHLALVDGAAVVSERLRFRPIYREDFRVLMAEGDPLSRLQRVTLEDLAPRPWIAQIGSPAHDRLGEAMRGVRENCRPRHLVSRAAEVQLLCQAGIGLSLTGSYEPLLPGLVSRPLDTPDLSRVVGVAEARGRSMSNAVLSFSRLLQAQSFC